MSKQDKSAEDKNKKTINWKKIGKVSIVSVGSMAILGYGLLFTKPGNSVVSFYVESLLNTDPNVPIKVEKFRMTTNNLNLQLKVSDLIDTKLDGKFSLFSGDFNGNYTMNIDDLSRLNIKELKDVKAKGSFKTQGKITSSEDGYKLEGFSKLYSGDLNYNMLIDGTKLKSLNFTLDNLQLANMLKQTNQVPVANADLKIVGKIKDATQGNLDGNIKTSVSKGRLNTVIVKKLYGKDIPSDFTFSVDIDTKLDKTKAISKVDIQNSYSTLSSPDFTIDLDSEAISGKYNLTIKDIGKLTSQSKNKNLKGEISTTGTISGTLSNAIIKGVSGMFGSKTNYTIALLKDEVKSLDMSIDGLSLKELAKQSGQKATIDGELNVDIDIKDARVGKLDGVITSNLSNLKLDKAVLKKQYDMQIKNNIELKATNHILLKGDEAIINTKLKTDIASLDINDLVYNLKDQTSKGTYVLKSASMKDLVGLSAIASKLPKEIANDTSALVKIEGTIKGGKNPIIDGKTNFLNGELNFKYANNLLNLNIVNSNISLSKNKEVIFDSSLNANIKYNTKRNKVDLLFSLSQSDTKVDVKKAVFDINKNKVYADVDFSSLDKKMNYIIEGDMDDPDITLKAQKPLLSKKYVDFIKNEVNKNLEDKKQRQNIYRVINILSKPNATLTKKDMLGIEAGVKTMVDNLKKEYSKFKNVEFSAKHLKNLEAISQKFREEKGILSDEDIKKVEERSKQIVQAMKKEWNSSYQKNKREQILSYFNSLGDKLAKGKLITKREIDNEKKELSKILDSYKSILNNRSKVEGELKKYDSIVKVVKLLKKDEKFDKEKFYKLLDDFKTMLEFAQQKIISIDKTDEQLNIINKIADALKSKSQIMKKL